MMSVLYLLILGGVSLKQFYLASLYPIFSQSSSPDNPHLIVILIVLLKRSNLENKVFNSFVWHWDTIFPLSSPTTAILGPFSPVQMKFLLFSTFLPSCFAHGGPSAYISFFFMFFPVCPRLTLADQLTRLDLWTVHRPQEVEYSSYLP